MLEKAICLFMMLCPQYKTVAEGGATWYGNYHHGRQMANGDLFNMYDKTIASRKIPLNTWVKVTHKGYSTWCKSTDRGPYGAMLDTGERVQRMHYKNGAWITKSFNSNEWVVWDDKPGKYRGLVDLSYGCMVSLVGFKGMFRPPNVNVKIEVIKWR